uniref:protein SSUH2 homolog n=1 Tax=Centroberyx gerrardi TaxID=166262 RepID=UPI003AACB36C
MAAEHQGYRFDLLLDPSQYTTVPPPPEEEEQKGKASLTPQPQVFNAFCLPNLTEQRIRALLMAWVRAKPLLSPCVVRGMTITSVTCEVAYCYKLETFTEKRSVCLRFEPHSKRIVPLPQTWEEEPKEARPWRVTVSPDQMFTDQVLKRRMAHTDRITPCPFCSGEKRVVCKYCCGSARRPCEACSGHRPWARRICRECRGERLVPCGPCMALGHACCDMCVGKGLLCYFDELMVEYHCHADHYLYEKTGGIPGTLVAHAVGDVIYSAGGLQVRPITGFPAEKVNAASQDLVKASVTGWLDRRIVQQRHQLKAVPVTWVRYRWRDTAGSVCIYGADLSVHWPHYPRCRVRCFPCG